MKTKLSTLLIEVLDKKLLFLGLTLSVVGTVLGLFIPQLIGNLLNQEFIGQLTQNKFLFGGAMVFFTSVYLSQTLASYFLARAGGQALQRLQEKIYRHLLDLPLETMERFQSGDLASRLTNDMTIVLKIVTTSLPKLLLNSLVLAGTTYFLLNINVSMTLLSFILLPILALVIFPLNQRLEKNFLAYQEGLGQLTGHLSHKFRQFKLVKAFLGEQEEVEQSHRFFSALVEQFNKIVTLSSIQSVLVNSLSMGGIMLILVIASREVMAERMTIATLTTFVLYLVQLLSPVSDFAELISDVSEFKGISQRLEEILNLEGDNPSAIAPFTDGDIQFNQVSFAYQGTTQPVLQGLDFVLPQGKHLAIIGESGSGKSTILSLLMSFYQGYQGEIKIGQTSLKDLSPEQIRQKIAYVSQNNQLFQGSLRDNLLYGKNRLVSEERLMEVLRVFDLEPVITKLDKGLDSQISDVGTGLSEGQKQRLCIARAFLVEADIYLFDEVTASLDKENEQKISSAIDRLTRGKTRVTVAHRLETVREADYYLNLQGSRMLFQPTTVPTIYQKAS